MRNGHVWLDGVITIASGEQRYNYSVNAYSTCYSLQDARQEKRRKNSRHGQ